MADDEENPILSAVVAFFATPLLMALLSGLLLPFSFLGGLALWLNWDWHAPTEWGSLGYLQAVSVSFLVGSLIGAHTIGLTREKGGAWIGAVSSMPISLIVYGWLLHAVQGWFA